MKIQAYLLTFAAFAILYMLRQGYSYSKPYFRAHFHYPIIFVSILDTCLFTGMAIGYLLRYKLINERQPMKYFLLMSLAMCLFFAFLPVAAIFSQFLSGKTVEYMLIGCIFCFGFLQFYFIPSFQIVLQKYYNNEHNELALTIWSTGGQIGKIIGFIILSIVGKQQNFKWQVTLIIFIALMMGISILLYWRLGSPKRKGQISNKNDNDYATFYSKNEQILPYPADTMQAHSASIHITWQQFKQFTRQYFFKFKTLVYLLLACCYRSTYVNFLLWLSDFMFHHHYQQLTGQLAIIFILAVIAGSFVIGKMYEHTIDPPHQREYSIYFMSIITILVLVGTLILNFCELNYIQFVLVTMFIGMSIGGSLKIIVFNGHVVVGKQPKKLEMLVTLSRGVTYLSVGLVDMCIGILMQMRQAQNSPHLHDSFFNVMMVVCVISVALLLVWVRVIRMQQKCTSQ